MLFSIYDENVTVTRVTETITKEPRKVPKPILQYVDDTPAASQPSHPQGSQPQIPPNKPADGVFGNMDDLLKMVDEAVFWKHQHLPTPKLSEG